MRRIAMTSVVFLGAVGAMVMAACSSSSAGNAGGATGSTTPIGPQDFPAQAVSAVCDNIATCCTSSGFAFDPAGCKATQLKEVGNLTSQAALDGVSWDANAAGACVALLRQAAASCVATPDAIAQLDAACQNILVGTKAPGTPCTSSSQCAAPEGAKASCPSGVDLGTGNGGGTSGNPPAPTCQVQMPQTHAKAGEPCNATCESSSGSSSCAGMASSGGAGAGGAGTTPPMGTCYVSDGVTCDFATFTCKPLAAVGSACMDSLECALGSTCAAGKCTPKAQAGEACAATSFDACATGLYCDAVTSTCAAAKAVGQPCASGVDNQCGDGAFCSQGKCAAQGQVASSQTCTGQSSSTPLPGTGTGSSGGTPNGP